MIDRRLLTDFGLALLIALPSVLPAAPNPWNTNNQFGRPDSAGSETVVIHGRDVRFAAGVPTGEPRYGSS